MRDIRPNETKRDEDLVWRLRRALPDSWRTVWGPGGKSGSDHIILQRYGSLRQIRIALVDAWEMVQLAEDMDFEAESKYKPAPVRRTTWSVT